MTREQFVNRWKNTVAGMALFGVATDVEATHSPNLRSLSNRASRTLEIPGEVERLLGRMYDDIAKPNGAAK